MQKKDRSLMARVATFYSPRFYLLFRAAREELATCCIACTAAATVDMNSGTDAEANGEAIRS